MSVLGNHHTPKLSFLLVPKQETNSTPDTQKPNILTLNAMIVMHMLLKEGSKWTNSQPLPFYSNFRGSIRSFDFRKNLAKHGSVNQWLNLLSFQ